jgi:hypothetical protein
MKAGFNKLIAHGLTGGVRSRLSGGSFKSGFLGSAVSYQYLLSFIIAFIFFYLLDCYFFIQYPKYPNSYK